VISFRADFVQETRILSHARPADFKPVGAGDRDRNSAASVRLRPAIPRSEPSLRLGIGAAFLAAMYEIARDQLQANRVLPIALRLLRQGG
jgi:hypothetical protein